MADRTIFVDGQTTLRDCWRDSGSVAGDNLTIVGRDMRRSVVYSSVDHRVALGGLTLEDCTLEVGSGSWFVGFVSRKTVVRLRRCWVKGPGSSSSVADVFTTCRLAEVSDCRWTGTLNGPVNADEVRGSGFEDIRSDVLSGCRLVEGCTVGEVTGGGGAHPDVHQVFRPEWTAGMGEYRVELRGLRVGERPCAAQYLHWTVLGSASSPGVMSAAVEDCDFADRPAGQVWASRITVGCSDLSWRGVRFGQPLHLGMRRLDRGVFVDCEFRKGIYASDPATRELLDRCEWRGVTVGSITGPGVYVPPNARVEVGQ